MFGQQDRFRRDEDRREKKVKTQTPNARHDADRKAISQAHATHNAAGKRVLDIREKHVVGLYTTR